MILHELYFAGLGDESRPGAVLTEALARDFGSVERWRAEFVAMGKAQGGGSGWVLLTWSPRDRRLINAWAADHTTTLAGGQPILALDMYEHAYHMDFGAAAAAYVDAFMANIDWSRLYARYQRAVEQCSEAFSASHDDAANAHLVDVRRAGAFELADALIEGAEWRDPGQVDAWASHLPADKEIVVYCVYGHEVGRATAMRLRAAGINARFLRGGFDGWKAAGGPLSPKR